MLEYHQQAGFDVLIGIDPVQGTNTDLSTVKKAYGDQIAIWGGVSGAITVEMGTEQEITTAVDKAASSLGISRASLYRKLNSSNNREPSQK